MVSFSASGEPMPLSVNVSWCMSTPEVPNVSMAAVEVVDPAAAPLPSPPFIMAEAVMAQMA